MQAETFSPACTFCCPDCHFSTGVIPLQSGPTIQGAIKGNKARKAIRDQQPKFKADYTDEEFKTKEIKKIETITTKDK